jgi:hypothetical protein
VKLPRAADGRWGARLRIPPEWSVLQDEPDRSSWDCGGMAATLEHWREDVAIDGYFLEEFRQDLRLQAALRGGGLIACELRPGLSGVWGLTKEPQRRAKTGTTYRAQLLVPTARGTLCLGALAHERPPAGERETSLSKPEQARGRDPYDYEYRANDAPAPGEIPSWRFPGALSLANESDLPDYDLLFEDHALTRVRRLLDDLKLEITEPSTFRVPRGRVAVGSARFFRPLGFVGQSETLIGEGVRCVRTSFNRYQAELWVAHHPGSAAELEEAAPRIWDQVLVGVPGGPKAERRIRPEAWGQRAGVRLDYELSDPERYGVACLLPWGDHLLEVHRLGPIWDWERAQADLRAILESLDDEGAPARPTTPEGVTPNGLRRVYRVLSWFAQGDDFVDPREARILTEVQHEFGISEEEAIHLGHEASGAGQIRLGRRAAERDLLVRRLVQVVTADGIFDPAEQRRLRLLAPRLGLDSVAAIRLIQDELE